MTPLPTPPSVCASYLYCHLLILHIFGWLLCVFLSIGGLIRPTCYLFLFNFVIPIIARINGTTPPPTLQIKLATKPLKHPYYHEHQLLVGCCVFILSFGRLRPRQHFLSIFRHFCHRPWYWWETYPSKNGATRWKPVAGVSDDGLSSPDLIATQN